MTQVSKITDQEYIPQEMPKQSRLMKAASLAKMMFKNAGEFRKLRVMGPDEERYVRPPREYQIPPFHDDMRYSTSNEKYLRPTRWCNPREPEVVAMANKLGAYELSDSEFAEAAYWFVKENLQFEVCPFDSAGATLKRGSGSCYHLINVFVALCRAAGIKARYKTYKMHFRGIEQAVVIDVDPVMKELFDATGGEIAEGEGEACIDGKWTVAYVGMNAAASAAAGLPVTKFGEDSIGMYFDALPGTIRRFESLPLQLGLSTKVMKWLTPPTLERMNVSINKARAIGRQEIEEAGGVEAYDQKARRKRELFSPEELLSAQALKHKDALVFKE
jgi:hypothetical protein